MGDRSKEELKAFEPSFDSLRPAEKNPADEAKPQQLIIRWANSPEEAEAIANSTYKRNKCLKRRGSALRRPFKDLKS